MVDKEDSPRAEGSPPSVEPGASGPDWQGVADLVRALRTARGAPSWTSEALVGVACGGVGVLAGWPLHEFFHAAPMDVAVALGITVAAAGILAYRRFGLSRRARALREEIDVALIVYEIALRMKEDGFEERATELLDEFLSELRVAFLRHQPSGPRWQLVKAQQERLEWARAEHEYRRIESEERRANAARTAAKDQLKSLKDALDSGSKLDAELARLNADLPAVEEPRVSAGVADEEEVPYSPEQEPKRRKEG